MERGLRYPKLAYSVPEAAEALGISKSKMYAITRIEGFPVVVLGKRRLIPIKPFEEWVQKMAAGQL